MALEGPCAKQVVGTNLISSRLLLSVLFPHHFLVPAGVPGLSVCLLFWHPLPSRPNLGHLEWVLQGLCPKRVCALFCAGVGLEKFHFRCPKAVLRLLKHRHLPPSWWWDRLSISLYREVHSASNIVIDFLAVRIL